MRILKIAIGSPIKPQHIGKSTRSPLKLDREVISGKLEIVQKPSQVVLKTRIINLYHHR